MPTNDQVTQADIDNVKAVRLSAAQDVAAQRARLGMKSRGPVMTKDLPPPSSDWQTVPWASQPDKFGNLGRQPARPSQPISADDIMSPETQSLMSDDPWQRVGNLADAVWEKISGKPTYQTLDLPKAKPRFSTVEQSIGMIPWGPEGFYSKAEQVLNETMQGIFTGDQLKGFLKSKGVKDEELKWSGLNELAQKAKVTKQEAMDTLAKAPRVSEIVLGAKPEELPALEDQHYILNQRINSLQNQMMRYEQANNLQFNGLGSQARTWYPAEYQSMLNDFDRLYEQRIQLEKQINEMGDRRSAQYDRPDLKLPGPSSNYREILLTHKPGFDTDKLAQWANMSVEEIKSLPEEEKRRVIEEFTQQHPDYSKFTGSHWDEPNVLAHLRLNERHMPDVSSEEIAGKQFYQEGPKVLHADEYQSDWANEARKNGIKGQGTYVPPTLDEFKQNFRTANDLPVNWEPGPMRSWQTMFDLHNEQMRLSFDAGKVEPAPYIEGSWPELVAKRHLLEAARDPDVKHVTWTTGQQQAERYSLDKHFSRIDLRQDGTLLAWQPGSNIPVIQQQTNGKPEDFIGQELADRLIQSQPRTDRFIGQQTIHGNQPYKTLQGPDLKVTNQGKRQFYDKIMPQTMKKLTKQEPRQIDIQGGNPPEELDHRRGETQSQFLDRRENPTQKVWSIPMTDSLRESILKKGFPLYSVVPPALMLGSIRKNLLPPPPQDAN